MPNASPVRTGPVYGRNRLERCLQAPELGPGILFFSGGTALRTLSLQLARYTSNSVHIVTPFDSGGSSAELRRAFGMPAVGDLRNRLLALADRTTPGARATWGLLAHRLPRDLDPQALCAILDALVDGSAGLAQEVPESARAVVRSLLCEFRERMPPGFDLRGASIGNLVLAGGYFRGGRDMASAVALFSGLVSTRGAVELAADCDVHLCAKLEDGSTVIGQHNITGKGAAPLASPVRSLRLCRSLDDPAPAEVHASVAALDRIAAAELICYPMGSFYTSVLAGLLPRGVGEAIAGNDCPKVYIPNTFPDPEQLGMTVCGSVKALLKVLRSSCNREIPTDRLLNCVLADSRRGVYPGPLEFEMVRGLGAEVLDAPLVSAQSAPRVDSRLLIRRLLALA